MLWVGRGLSYHGPGKIRPFLGTDFQQVALQNGHPLKQLPTGGRAVSIGDRSDTSQRCWMCAAPAASGCGARLVMVASSARCLDALGYQVQRGSGQDKVRIEVPRCAGCRNWVNNWIAVLATVTVAGGIAGTLIQSFVFPDLAAPLGLKVDHHGFGNIGTGIGFALGFVVALLAMAWERKRSGRQSANSYPPVVSLRQIGWSFASD